MRGCFPQSLKLTLLKCYFVLGMTAGLEPEVFATPKIAIRSSTLNHLGTTDWTERNPGLAIRIETEFKAVDTIQQFLAKFGTAIF